MIATVRRAIQDHIKSTTVSTSAITPVSRAKRLEREPDMTPLTGGSDLYFAKYKKFMYMRETDKNLDVKSFCVKNRLDVRAFTEELKRHGVYLKEVL